MYKLYEFIRSIFVVVLFFVIEIVAMHYYAHSTDYTQARILSQSNRIVGAIHGSLYDLQHFFSLPRENRQLTERIAALENELSYFRDQAVYASLDTMERNAERPFVYTTARVVTNSINKRQNLITLNKGLLDNITTESAVITATGELVGYISDCSDRFAVVKSILNTTFFTSGEVNGHSGSISWDGRDAWHVKMSEVSKYAEAKVGDTVVTTSYSRFPEGLMIGTVDHISRNDTRGIYTLRVRLAADMTALHNVLVIFNRNADELQELESSTHIEEKETKR